MKNSFVFFMLATWFICQNTLVHAAPQVKEQSAKAISPDDGYYYWFGYYDKLLSDPKNRYVLAMRTNFEHRTPASEDLIQVGMIDSKRGNRWTKLGESSAWCWQQGCMLQFASMEFKRWEKVFFESTHEGKGRRVYMIDISGITGNKY